MQPKRKQQQQQQEFRAATQTQTPRQLQLQLQPQNYNNKIKMSRIHLNRQKRHSSFTSFKLSQSAVIFCPLVTITIFIIIIITTTTTTSNQLAQATYLQHKPQQQQQQQQIPITSLLPEPQAPIITPFGFNQNVQENQRSSIMCAISSGDLPLEINWLKDGQLLTPQLAQSKRITIKPDLELSTLKFGPVRLEHAGNYTCVAKNKVGIQTHSAQLLVHGEPRWLREPQHEPIVATRGQTIVIDCQTIGWPKPQQSWQIKTHTQSEFTSLAATGRISLAANGSLVIHNADKSDEANYLCKSNNGIGKGISWSTSLKVTVPAHFESTKQQTSIVRKQNQVQLRCDAFGDEPITIEWFKNKQRLTTNDLEARYTIHNKPLQNGLISLLLIKQTQRQDNSIYECVTRNPVGRDRLPIELIVQEEPDNIQELQATLINSRSVTLMWTEPYDGRSAITNYLFQYKKVQEASGSLTEIDFLDVSGGSGSGGGGGVGVGVGVGGGSISVGGQALDLTASGLGQLKPLVLTTSTTADDWQQASRILLPVQANPQANGTTRSITIDKLDPSTKYVLRALAINSIGQSKFSQPMEFSTEEEAPEIGPTNIRAQAINSTSIQVSWDEIPKSKQLGRIHGYYIGYRIAQQANSTIPHSFVYKPYVINDLVTQQQQQQPGQQLLMDSMASQIQSTQSSSLNPVQTTRLETNLQDLRRDTNYEITVVAFNSRGSGPSSDFVLCKTIEMEAPKAVKLQIRRESNESIYIEWQRDPLDQNPVDYYDLYQEKNSASQEWVHLRLPGNQSQYKAPGLKCGTRYQFYIVAHNKVGKSQPSEVVSASTSGKLPVIPSKMSLIKMVNSTCLLVNLNSFQDNGCRIKTFTVRYRVEKSSAPNGSTLISSNGMQASHQALSSLGGGSGIGGGGSSSSGIGSQQMLANSKTSSGMAGLAGGQAALAIPSEWTSIRPKSNAKHQRANEEDRMEYLCDLSPIGEYTIHVAASNDVGRSEIEYTVLMTSDELRHSTLRELVEFLSNLPNIFAYIPSLLIFLLAGLFLALVGLILYTSAIKYYQKFVIMHNQLRATRRAKQDEKRRRKLNNQRHQQKLDLWADEYDEEEDGDEDGDDEETEDDSSASSNAIHPQFGGPNGRGAHYISNIANSAFDTSSIDSPCNNVKFGNGSCLSTASTDSIHGRFQCLNSKQYVKMNEYTMLPSISANLSPANDIYGPLGPRPTAQQQQQQQHQEQSANNSLYYSTLRRTNMQTYLPHQRQQHQHQRSSPSQATIQLSSSQQQQHGIQRRRSQNVADIYGYYLAPQTNANTSQRADEVANSIFVPPQQIIYSAPNIRRQPVFL